MISKMQQTTITTALPQHTANNRTNNHDKYNCFGQFVNIQNMPIGFQPAIDDHHNNNTDRNGCVYMNGAAKENVAVGAHTNSERTYFMLQNVKTFVPAERAAPLKIGQDLLVLNGDGCPIENGHHANGGDTIDEAFVSSPEYMKSHDENSGSLTGSDAATAGDLVGLNGLDEKASDPRRARRPMNAFLMFCKRHRFIVREKYPNLENRAITKILGDWWNCLRDDEKERFTTLAEEFKDFFLTANPTFEWYKLPAPPLRPAVSHRPVDPKPIGHNGIIDHAMNDTSHADTASNVVNVKVEENGYNDSQPQQTSNVGMFRLADETQMGGLNSLMASPEKIAVKQEIDVDEPMEATIKKDIPFDEQALHNELKEARIFLQRTISGSSDSDSYTNGVSGSIKCNGSSRSGTPSSPDKAFEFDFEDDAANARKSSRSCKGKLYKEFMSKVVVPPKKSKPRTTSSSSSALVSSATESHWLANSRTAAHTNGKGDHEPFDHMYATNGMKRISDDGHHNQNGLDDSKFYANIFGLDEKIEALPLLNLDMYLSRKRDTKKRKKTGGKRANKASKAVAAAATATAAASAFEPPVKVAKVTKSETAQEAKARMMMVGSQKRKARKESITRREVANVTATVESVIVRETVDLGDIRHMNAAGGENDLLFLAIVAEAMQ